jgi:tetratricopeptide (TPR) repeat protein
MDHYDPNAVIQAANDKLASSGDIEGGSIVFQTALLDWCDEAREGVPNGVDLETLTEAIATLWIAYAQFYANHNQFKSATEAYEQAVSDPVAKHVGRVWLDYARFLEERNKLKSAQEVYIRVLVQDSQTVDEQDQALLWNEFLEMMQKTNPELTLRELKGAVESERVRPEPVASEESTEDAARPTKRPRVDSNASNASMNQQENKTYVVTPESVAQEANVFSEILQQRTLPPDVAGGWMIRDGSGPAFRPEPLLFQPSPPKLADPTAKDLLGAVLALKLIECLLGPAGSVLLNVCQGLWTLQALKEKESKNAIDLLDETTTREYEQLEATLDARLAVAGGAASAVQQMNATERQAFQSTCIQQRENVMTGLAWDFRQVLCLQQQVLSKLNVPGFEGPTVDTSALERQAKICSYLHSAFFLRNRIGETPHVNMLQKQVGRLQAEIQQNGASNSPLPPQQQGHPALISALGQGDSGGYNTYNPAAPFMMPSQQMQFNMPQQQMPMMQGGMQPLYGYQQVQQHQQQPPMMPPLPQQQQQQQQMMLQQQQQGQYGAVPQQYYHQQ